jgi:acyl carrier protein
MKATPASILSLLVAAAGAPGPARPSREPAVDLVERIRAMTAEQVTAQAGEINVDRPLSEQGCDDDDIFELIISLEETYCIEIDDAEYGSDGNTIDKTLTVRNLARIVTSHF